MNARILVTRPAAQSGDLCARLREHDLEPIAVPTVAIDRESTAPLLDAMLEDLDGVEWLVLTSANGAEALAERLAATGRHVPESVRVAAVGPATAAALDEAGVRVDHIPDEYLTVAIADGLGDVAGQRVVLARADAATPDLREALDRAGAIVEEVVAYRTIEGPADSRDRLHVALQRDVAGTTFTSSSTVRGLLRLASPIDRHRARTIPAFCIGPVTAETARRSGFDVAIVADDHTAGGLADAIVTHLSHGAR